MTSALERLREAGEAPAKALQAAHREIKEAHERLTSVQAAHRLAEVEGRDTEANKALFEAEALTARETRARLRLASLAEGSFEAARNSARLRKLANEAIEEVVAELDRLAADKEKAAERVRRLEAETRNAQLPFVQAHVRQEHLMGTLARATRLVFGKRLPDGLVLPKPGYYLRSANRAAPLATQAKIANSAICTNHEDPINGQLE